jgi:hypothetical protein
MDSLRTKENSFNKISIFFIKTLQEKIFKIFSSFSLNGLESFDLNLFQAKDKLPLELRPFLNQLSNEL